MENQVNKTKTPGERFPDLLGKDATGREVKLSDYPGKNFIIYFYPKDNTSGCTLEAKSLRDHYGDLLDRGYQVIGVSKDNEASHQKFACKYELPFPLIADTELTLCREAGVWQKKKMAGREYMGIVRTTFITDSEGVVTHRIDKVKTATAAEQIIDIIDGQQK